MSRRKTYVMGAVILILSACLPLAAQAPISVRPRPESPPNTQRLSLNGLDIAIDAQSGSLRQISSPDAGVILNSASDSAGLVDVAYPVQDFLPLRLASRFSKANIEIDKNSGGATIIWDPLGPSRTNVKLPDGKVVARLKISAAPDGRSVILQCTIENKSSAPIPQVLFPDLRGMRPLAGPAETQLRFGTGYPVYPYTEPAIPLYTAQFYVNSGWKEYPPSTGVYGVNTLRWLDFGGYKGGLSIWQKGWGATERPTVRTYRSQADPADLRIIWEYRSGIKPGQTWTSDEVCLTPHPGGWAKGIETYREFARSKHPQRPLPERVRDGLGFQTIFMIQAPETDPAHAAFRFSDIPKVAADAKAHGLNEVCMWGWCDYFNLPWKLRRELGTPEEFVGGIRKAREIGVEVSPFVSCVLVRNSLAERYGGTPGGPAWVYHPDLIPVMDPYYLGAGAPLQFWSIFSADPHNQNWQADVIATFKEWLDQGITCWSWDQAFADAPGSGGLTDTLANLRKLAREKDPEAIFSGEQVTSYELDGGVLDYTWNWLDYTDAGPLTNVFGTPRLNANIEDSPRIVKAAFLDNLYLNAFPRKPDQPNGTAMISEKPAMATALKEVAALRKKFLPWFVDGIFIGDSVLSEPCPGFIRGYQKADGLLVIAMNNLDQTRALTIRSRLDWWLPKAARYEVKHYGTDGNLLETTSAEGADWTGTTRELKPLDIAFFEIRRH
jgi:hypothetical protein